MSFSANDNQSSAQTATALQSAPTDGTSIFVDHVSFFNGAVAGNFRLVEDTGGTPVDLMEPVYLGINENITMNFESPLKLSADVDLGYSSVSATTQSILIGGSGGAAPAPAYDPGMMTFDGSTGYYSHATLTTTGNLATGIIRINRASFSGVSAEYVYRVNGIGSSNMRIGAILIANDSAATTAQSKIVMQTENSSGAIVSKLVSTNVVCDGSDHTIFYAYDGDNGTAILYVDGVDADDTGSAHRIAPTTGTLSTGTTVETFVGASAAATSLYGGSAGYFGYRNAYLTNPTDWYHPTNGLQEIDESGWTEWGSQPEFWEAQGEMDAQEGSEGNMSVTGTITGPA